MLTSGHLRMSRISDSLRIYTKICFEFRTLNRDPVSQQFTATERTQLTFIRTSRELPQRISFNPGHSNICFFFSHNTRAGLNLETLAFFYTSYTQNTGLLQKYTISHAANLAELYRLFWPSLSIHSPHACVICFRFCGPLLPGEGPPDAGEEATRRKELKIQPRR
jgi:hypothetical protein